MSSGRAEQQGDDAPTVPRFQVTRPTPASSPGGHSADGRPPVGDDVMTQPIWYQPKPRAVAVTPGPARRAAGEDPENARKAATATLAAGGVAAVPGRVVTAARSVIGMAGAQLRAALAALARWRPTTRGWGLVSLLSVLVGVLFAAAFVILSRTSPPQLGELDVDTAARHTAHAPVPAGAAAVAEHPRGGEEVQGATTTRPSAAAPKPAHETAAPPSTEASSEGEAAALQEAQRLTHRGDALLKQGRLYQARGFYRRALKTIPGHPAALAGLARVNLRRGDGTRALAQASALLRRNRQHPEHLLLMGDALHAVKREGPARAHWRAAAARGSAEARARLRREKRPRTKRKGAE